MSKEEFKKTLAINEKVSTVILLFLLGLRLADYYLPTWLFGTNIPSWYSNWYVGIAYIMTVAIMLLNRHRLAALNIDRPFVIAVMIGGFLYFFFLPPDVGILAAITAALVFWAYQNNHLTLKNTVQYPSGTVPLISIAVLLALLPIAVFHPTFEKSLSLKSIIASAFQTQVALTVYEEVIFRGALWAFLRKFGLREHLVFFIQAFLFWIAHSRYMVLGHVYSFWVALPLASLIYGFLAWRSKSLTPSTLAHLLFNFTTTLIKELV